MKYWIPALVLSAFSVTALPMSLAEQEDAVPQASDEAAALAIGQAYLTGISGGDLDELDVLFVAGDGSSIYENASDEGSWPHYKEHHLAPEQESVKNFVFTTKEAKAEPCGTGFLVRHIGGFSLEAGGETLNYRAAVSFTLVPTGDGLRILHLHWSSRKAR